MATAVSLSEMPFAWVWAKNEAATGVLCTNEGAPQPSRPFAKPRLARRVPLDNRRVHLSNGHTYQMDSPIGLDLKQAKWALEDTL